MEGKSRELPSARGGVGPLSETRNLYVNGSASIAELREFLASLKGRSPQEVIGIVSSGLLIQSMVLATFLTVVFFAAFTVGPYFLYGPPKKKDIANKAAPGAEAATTNSATAAAPATTDGKAGDATVAPAATENAKSKSPDASKAAKAMGLDEVKTADPTKNPLDKGSDIDKLLDGVD